MKLNNILHSVIFILILTSVNDAEAANCYPYNGQILRFNYDYTFNFNENRPGYETSWQENNLPNGYDIGGECKDRKINTYFTFKESPGLTSADSSSGAQWFNIPENDYLQVAMQVFLAGRVQVFVNIPAIAIDNGCTSTNSCTGRFSTGSRVKVKIRVKRKFVGQSFIINREIGYVYAATSSSDRPTQEIVVISLNATVNVPQSCSFDVGDIVEFDFGQIPSDAFSRAGAGNRAVGVNVISKNLSLSCRNIAAQEMMSARLEVTQPKDNIIVSNNPDVGFQVANKDNTVLIPNNTNSKIPFRLNENSRGNFILNAWPVSITGKQPKPGAVNAEGHIRIDFD